MKQWDTFISHASEDKELVAKPLALALKQRGLRVWLDEFQLRIGDSLRKTIDEGLANSRFGVVILSPSFFSKHWTSRELEGLFALEETGRGILLPVWHRVDKAAVQRYSPMLAGIKSGQTLKGIEKLADELADRVFDASYGELATDSRELATLLAKRASRDAVGELFSSRPGLLGRMLADPIEGRVVVAPQFGRYSVDFCVGEFYPSIGDYDDWRVIRLADPLDPLFPSRNTPSPGVVTGLKLLEAVRKVVARDLRVARKKVAGIKSTFTGVLVAGRRPQPRSKMTKLLRDFNEGLSDCKLHTYDWLLDLTMTNKD